MSTVIKHLDRWEACWCLMFVSIWYRRKIYGYVHSIRPDLLLNTARTDEYFTTLSWNLTSCDLNPAFHWFTNIHFLKCSLGYKAVNFTFHLISASRENEATWGRILSCLVAELPMRLEPIKYSINFCMGEKPLTQTTKTYHRTALSS